MNLDKIPILNKELNNIKLTISQLEAKYLKITQM